MDSKLISKTNITCDECGRELKLDEVHRLEDGDTILCPECHESTEIIAKLQTLYRGTDIIHEAELLREVMDKKGWKLEKTSEQLGISVTRLHMLLYILRTSTEEDLDKFSDPKWTAWGAYTNLKKRLATS